MKKAQMEIMGMVIVVALIAIGLFFVISFQVGKKPSELKQNYQQSELAANILNVLLRTNVPECKNLDVTELLIDCSFLRRVHCAGIDSCTKANQTAGIIIRDTLDTSGYKDKYYFTAKLDAETKAVVGSPCKGNFKTKIFPVPTDRGSPLIIKLDICS